MAATSGSIMVERPCGEVFAYLADPRTHHEWQPDLIRTELVAGDTIGVGMQAVEVRKMFGREMRTPFEITRHEPPNRQDFHTTGGPIRPDGVLSCKQQGDGTLVSYEFNFNGPLAWLFPRIIGRGMKGDLARLKKQLEQR